MTSVGDSVGCCSDHKIFFKINLGQSCAVLNHENNPDRSRYVRGVLYSVLAPPVGCTSRGRHCSCALCAISAQSGCCEMSPDTARLRPDRAPAPRPSRGVSGGGRRALPGDIQNARDCLVATNSARMAAFGAWLGSTWLARRPRANEPQNGLGIPVRQMLPFLLSSSPPSNPGRSRYLRGVLYALRYIVMPLVGLGAGARSGRNLAVSGDISQHPDCAEIAQLQCRPLEVKPTGGARKARPGDIRNGRVWSDSLRWSRMALCGA